MAQDPYTDPDMIQAMYLDPENEVLHVEYLLQTSAIQTGISGWLGGGGVTGTDNVVGISIEIGEPSGPENQPGTPERQVEFPLP